MRGHRLLLGWEVRKEALDVLAEEEVHPHQVWDEKVRKKQQTEKVWS